MTNIVQEVFSQQDVDLKAKLDAAAATMQTKYYDAIQAR